MKDFTPEEQTIYAAGVALEIQVNRSQSWFDFFSEFLPDGNTESRDVSANGLIVGDMFTAGDVINAS